MATYQKIAQLQEQIQQEFGAVLALIQQIKSNSLPEFNLANYKNVIDVRPGYKIIKGIIKKVPTIVFLVDQKKPAQDLSPAQTIPEAIDGIPTDVSTISPFEKARKANKEALEGMLPGTNVAGAKYLLDSPEFDQGFLGTSEAFIPHIGYVPPTNVQLTEVTEPMTVICHVSPEEGWNQLKPFLASVNADFRLGMYDYSAPHVRDAMIDVAKKVAEINIVYDGKAPAGIGKSGVKQFDVSEDEINQDIEENKVGTFNAVKAKLGKNGLFANAYHIKVAVKDQEAFWLSSGNEQSSNQPNFNSTIPGMQPYLTPFSKALQNFNREWHVNIQNKTLAGIYYKFLEYDQEQSAALDESFMNAPILPLLDSEQLLPDAQMEALVNTDGLQPFKPETLVFDERNPLKVQPVLTPDNYIATIQPLIEAAQKRIFFQNQYITIGKQMTDEYIGLLNALKAKSEDANIDFRVILRNEGDVRLMVENLVAYGFDQSKIKIQNNCHNKGIIIDEDILVLGSHNYSNSGVQFNRDATLVFYSKAIQSYYENVYEFDWKNLAVNRVPEESVNNSNSGSEEGFFRVPQIKQSLKTT